MGAQVATGSAKARNINDAWKQVYEEANEYSGHQEGYSGDLNTCDFTKDLTYKLKTMSVRELIDYIENNCPKREAWGFCTKPGKENNNKTKTQVENTPQKGTRKWKTVYEAIDRWSGHTAVTADSQTECIKKARAYVEKNPKVTLVVQINKVLEKGNTVCAKISYKKSKTESLGEYYFVGLASC